MRTLSRVPFNTRPEDLLSSKELRRVRRDHEIVFRSFIRRLSSAPGYGRRFDREDLEQEAMMTAAVVLGGRERLPLDEEGKLLNRSLRNLEVYFWQVSIRTSVEMVARSDEDAVSVVLDCLPCPSAGPERVAQIKELFVQKLSETRFPEALSRLALGSYKSIGSLATEGTERAIRYEFDRLQETPTP